MIGKVFMYTLTITGTAFLLYAAKRNESVKKEYDELLNRIRQGIKAK